MKKNVVLVRAKISFIVLIPVGVVDDDGTAAAGGRLAVVRQKLAEVSRSCQTFQAGFKLQRVRKTLINLYFKFFIEERLLSFWLSTCKQLKIFKQ